jgi:hypothetical protein
MQTLCNYLFVADELPSHKATETEAITVGAIDAWLSEKGVSNPKQTSGVFNSLTPEGGGSFTRNRFETNDSSLLEVQLEELSKGGQIFTTTLSVVKNDSKVIVYATQLVHNVSVRVAPMVTDPRCPKILRRILELVPIWTFHGEKLPAPVPTVYADEKDGFELAQFITRPSRALPILVVSQNEGEPVWSKIAEQLAYDLAGLAYVASISDAASWALTESLGKINSCYMGAIRLYWPNTASTEDVPVRSTVWTASTLLSNDHDGKGALRFRSTARRTVMSIAAITVEPPVEIKQIHSYIGRKQLRELEAKVAADSAELKVAQLFFSENEQLRAQVEELQKDVRNWSSRAQVAEYALSQGSNAQTDNVDDIQPSNETDSLPESGDIRFYKKTHSTPNHDVFVPVTDCGHSSWQDASKAEKAKKGLIKLLGNDGWKTVHHCGTCKGGGLWRVRW